MEAHFLTYSDSRFQKGRDETCFLGRDVWDIGDVIAHNEKNKQILDGRRRENGAGNWRRRWTLSHKPLGLTGSTRFHFFSITSGHRNSIRSLVFIILHTLVVDHRVVYSFQKCELDLNGDYW